jgi:hypothetical protein
VRLEAHFLAGEVAEDVGQQFRANPVAPRARHHVDLVDVDVVWALPNRGVADVVAPLVMGVEPMCAATGLTAGVGDQANVVEYSH